MPKRPLPFEYNGNDWINSGSLEASSTEDGVVRIEITYLEFTVMPRDGAVKFRDWLNEVLQ